MKIRTKRLAYEKVVNLPRPKDAKPLRPHIIFRVLIRLLSIPDLLAVRFHHTERNLEAAGEGPWLILMNHSSFVDLKLAYKVLFPRPFCIVCTSDGFVGKPWLMRLIGCIPTKKFVSDLGLVGKMLYTLKEKQTSVLLFPEASYSFDGRATPLPRRMGILLKKLDVPVVQISTKGAFARDPLYNGLQNRKVQVSAEISCLLTREQIKEMSVQELDTVLDEAFHYDHFAWQKENNVVIDEPFRADGLERILYRCSTCNCETAMEGKGTELTCHQCGTRHRLSTLGELEQYDGTSRFSHIPDWYQWERDCVREELAAGTYRMDIPVRIGMMVDYKAIYMVGEGRLVHTLEGFELTGCEGKLHFVQQAKSSYSLYADYFWYEIGDVICIGDQDCLYYCFPKEHYPVAKARLAAEELYKMVRKRA